MKEDVVKALIAHKERHKSKGHGFGAVFHKENQKMGTVCVGGHGVQDLVDDNGRIRRLTPTECARLQTIPEWYTWQCSETQQYKMLGNGWTVEVIKHIFSYLNK